MSWRTRRGILQWSIHYIYSVTREIAGKIQTPPLAQWQPFELVLAICAFSFLLNFRAQMGSTIALCRFLDWSLKRRARLYGCHCVASHSEAPVSLCALPVHSQTPRSSIVLSLFLKCYDFELATSADLARSHQRKQTFYGNPKMHTLQHIYLVISLTSLDRVQNFNFAINLFKSTRLFSIE